MTEKSAQVEGDSLTGQRLCLCELGEIKHYGPGGKGSPSVERQKGERETVDCGIVLGQEENLSRPWTRNEKSREIASVL